MKTRPSTERVKDCCYVNKEQKQRGRAGGGGKQERKGERAVRGESLHPPVY